MDGVAADPDWSVWVPAPGPEDLDPEPVDVQTWAARWAGLCLRSAGVEATEEGTQMVQELLMLVGDRNLPEGVPWFLKWIHFPEPTDTVPLPVMLSIYDAEGKREETLRAMVGADDPDAVEPAVIDEYGGCPGLGSGYKGLVYYSPDDEDGSPEILAMLGYAWRVSLDGEETDVRLWTTQRPDRVIAATDDIDDLAATLQIVQTDAPYPAPDLDQVQQ